MLRGYRPEATMADESPELFEMVGTLTEWDGHRGYMLSDAGDRFQLSNLRDAIRGVSFPYSVGCRIHCVVSAEVVYTVRDVRFVVPQKPDANLDRVKALAKENFARAHGPVRAQLEFPETYTGTMESVDRRKKKGVVRRDDGELMPFYRDDVDVKKGQKITPGMHVRFHALHAGDRWTVTRILSLKKAPSL
jgi:hypothetical protein